MLALPNALRPDVAGLLVRRPGVRSLAARRHAARNSGRMLCPGAHAGPASLPQPCQCLRVPQKSRIRRGTYRVRDPSPQTRTACPEGHESHALYECFLRAHTHCPAESTPRRVDPLRESLPSSRGDWIQSPALYSSFTAFSMAAWREAMHPGSTELHALPPTCVPAGPFI